MKSGSRSCALAAASSSALGISRRKITHTSTSIWAMPVRSAAPIALRYSVSIRAWAHTKLIRQIVLTVTWTKLKSSNAASLPRQIRTLRARGGYRFSPVEVVHGRVSHVARLAELKNLFGAHIEAAPAHHRVGEGSIS